MCFGQAVCFWDRLCGVVECIVSETGWVTLHDRKRQPRGSCRATVVSQSPWFKSRLHANEPCSSIYRF